jgi:hypothetical protein
MVLKEGNRTHFDIPACQVVHNILPPKSQIRPQFPHVIMRRRGQLSHIRDAQNVKHSKFLSINIFQHSNCAKASRVDLPRKGKLAPSIEKTPAHQVQS